MNCMSVVINMGTFDAVLYESHHKVSVESYFNQLKRLNPKYPIEISDSPRRLKEQFSEIEFCEKLEV
jgi:hypothetical protein